jgi:hypothetical protein
MTILIEKNALLMKIESKVKNFRLIELNKICHFKMRVHNEKYSNT